MKNGQGPGHPAPAGRRPRFPGYDGSYYPDEPKAGKILADYVLKQLGALPDKPVQLGIHDYPAPWATARTDELEKMIKGDPDYEVVATTQTDPANLVNGTRKTVTDQITANPDIKMFWFSFDSAGPGGRPGGLGEVPGQEVPGQADGGHLPR